ncbi:unnamed protein product [marine sediment metagenome]|uniref:Uncharacterized protein n=1 Tax=marine sediment metagenome TaxID=412755 RepID=X1L887_9ZZZZ
MTKCVICERRPANGNGRCAPCDSKLEAQSNRQKPEQPKHYLTYRGHVVGLYPDGNGALKARLLNRKPENLPKSRTLNLNHYCEGYTRDKIKAFKRCILQLANA